MSSATIRAPDAATLDLYCDRVASAVGRLSVRVFGMAHEDGIALAHHLGRALQLTNILRDVDEDAEIGRLYLPNEALRDAGIMSDDPQIVLASPQIGKACAVRRRAGAGTFPAVGHHHGAQPARGGADAAHHGFGLPHDPGAADCARV